jgi:hypothetical protein
LSASPFFPDPKSISKKKLFHSHFLAKDVKKNGRKALKMLRRIAEAREAWRETRINQATLYPNLRVPMYVSCSIHKDFFLFVFFFFLLTQ